MLIDYKNYPLIISNLSVYSLFNTAIITGNIKISFISIISKKF